MKIKKRKSKKHRTPKQIQATKENFAIVKLKGMLTNMNLIRKDFPDVALEFILGESAIEEAILTIKELQEERIKGA